jgi:hypothetical protein
MTEPGEAENAWRQDVDEAQALTFFLTNLLAGQSPRLPSLLMVLALLTLALSWHLLY